MISIVRSLPLAGCWMFTQARRLSVGSKYRPVNSEPTVPFDAQRAEPLAGVVEIAVPVQVPGEPDVIVDAAVAVLDDVDVAVVIDGEVVGVRQAHSPTGRPVARSMVFRLAKTVIR